MTIGELRKALAGLDEGAPVLIDGDPFPLDVKGIDQILVPTPMGNLIAGIALVPEREDEGGEEDW